MHRFELLTYFATKRTDRLNCPPLMCSQCKKLSPEIAKIPCQYRQARQALAIELLAKEFPQPAKSTIEIGRIEEDDPLANFYRKLNPNMKFPIVLTMKFIDGTKQPAESTPPNDSTEMAIDLHGVYRNKHDKKLYKITLKGEQSVGIWVCDCGEKQSAFYIPISEFRQHYEPYTQPSDSTEQKTLRLLNMYKCKGRSDWNCRKAFGNIWYRADLQGAIFDIVIQQPEADALIKSAIQKETVDALNRLACEGHTDWEYRQSRFGIEYYGYGGLIRSQSDADKLIADTERKQAEQSIKIECKNILQSMVTNMKEGISKLENDVENELKNIEQSKQPTTMDGFIHTGDPDPNPEQPTVTNDKLEKWEQKLVSIISEITPYGWQEVKEQYLLSKKSFDLTLQSLQKANVMCIPPQEALYILLHPPQPITTTASAPRAKIISMETTSSELSTALIIRTAKCIARYQRRLAKKHNEIQDLKIESFHLGLEGIIKSNRITELEKALAIKISEGIADNLAKGMCKAIPDVAIEFENLQTHCDNQRNQLTIFENLHKTESETITKLRIENGKLQKKIQKLLLTVTIKFDATEFSEQIEKLTDELSKGKGEQ
jgi:hypothetical protein